MSTNSQRDRAPGTAASSKKKSSPKAASSKHAAKGQNGASHKSDYVRKFGFDVKPAEIVAKAKADGISLSPEYVYEIRRLAKKSAGKAPARRRGRPPKAAAQSHAPAAAKSGDLEKAFRTSAADLLLARGVKTAQALLDDVVARVRAAAEGR